MSPESNPLTCAVISISQADTLDSDGNGARLAYRLVNAGHRLAAIRIVGDDDHAICAQVQAWLDGGSVDIVLTVCDAADDDSSELPLVILTSGETKTAQFTSAVHDAELGYVSIINLRSAHQLAA